MFGLYVKFYILLEDLDVPTITLERNAYDVRLSSHISCMLFTFCLEMQVLMASQKPQFLPPFPSEKSIERSRKFALRNDVLLWLQESNLGWSRDSAFSVGAAFVTALTDSLWYIDGHKATLDGRACTVPQEFRRFQGYNQPEKNKHRKRIVENLNCTSLDLYSSILNNFVL